MKNQTTKRSSFSGKIGFVLSAAGASVGLGNIWRFPYLAAKYGGGIFLLIYIILALTFGYTMIMVIVLVLEVRITDCVPEVNRSRSLYMKAMSIHQKGDTSDNSSRSEEHTSELQSRE